MQIELTSRHGEMAGDIRQLIEQKAQKLRHLFERMTAIQETVDMQPRLGVEVALHRLEGQLRRHKQRQQDHRRQVPLGELAREDKRDAETSSGSENQATVGQ